MSTSDNYTRFNVGDKVSFATVTQSARGSISFKSREGVVTGIQGRVLVVKSKGKQYGVFHDDARKLGEKTTLTEYVEKLSGKGDA
jgi:hypothetical protein